MIHDLKRLIRHRARRLQRSATWDRRTAHDQALELPLKPATVSELLKRRAAEAGLDTATAKRLSGHSMRVGAAQDMAAAGIELVAIMHAGGWRSPEMVMRYIEHMDIRKSGMARMYENR